jgi:RNA polymerase sigma factor (sigma-70 family)
MATAPLGSLLRHLHQLAAGPAPPWTDRQLVDEFAAHHDEAAFTALVGRHGPMVLRVCRRVLRHEQDVEDAFQATFLVLARHIGSIRKRDSVSSWLHGVAYRTAMKAKRSAARRRKHEGKLLPSPVSQPAGTSWDDVQAALDEEIERLPDPYRAAFVLCVLEAKSGKDAAAELGVKEGTMWSRVARARQLLQRRLTRRGIKLTALLAALSVVEGVGQATPPATLAAVTVRLGLSVAAGEPAAVIPTHIAALAAGVTRAMSLSKTKITTVALIAASLLVAAGGALAYQTFATGQETTPEAARPPEPPTKADSAPREARPDEANVTATFSGRVLDPDGKPVAGAKVVFHQRQPYGELPDFFPEPVTGTTDGAGRYHLRGTVHMNAPARDRQPQLTLTAHVPGYGPAATVEAHSADELKDRTLRLVKDDVPLRGRILDLEGTPIPGVSVRPVAVVANAANDLGRLVKSIETKDSWAELPDVHKTNIAFSAAAAGLTQTAVTDRDGKFSLSGFGRERIVVLRLDGPTIATCLFNAMTSDRPTVRGIRPVRKPDFSVHNEPYDYAYGATFDFVPGPSVVFEGSVRDQDTGKALAGVMVRHQIAYDFGWAEDELTTTTDADGRYRLAGVSRASLGPYRTWVVEFVPPAGQPYLAAGFSPLPPVLGKPIRLDVGLKRGVLVKGRVTDKATGRPVQAIVEYFAFEDNPNVRQVGRSWRSEVVSSKKDGSFSLTALPGRGIVAARTDAMRRGTYLVGKGASAIPGLNAQLGGSFTTRPYICQPGRFEVLVGIEPDAKADVVACDIQLDPGKVVRGTVLDPDGKPLAGVRIRGPFWSEVSMRDLPSAAFTIPAVNPDKPQAYFFEHPKKRLAAAVVLKGDEPEGFTLTLKPTATVTGRLVTEDGEPVAKADIRGRLEAGQLNLTLPYNGFFWGGTTGADGRFKIEGLFAGVRIGAWTDSGTVFERLTLKPGEVRDLGDTKVKNRSP